MVGLLHRNVSNFAGWRTKQRLIVIESDDWGSIRMPSRKTYERLKAKGLDLDGGDAMRYNQNDTLASADDLSCLYEVLSNAKGASGNAAVFTAVSLVANPDFQKIREDNFAQYHYEPFTETLSKGGLSDALNMWKQGIREHLFVPQFHGREHLNVAAWMRALQRNETQTRLGFDYGMWGFNKPNPYGVSYQAAFDLESVEDLETQRDAIVTGLELFGNLHGYKAEFFVPPNGPINNSLERAAADNGVRFMSAAKIQREALGDGKTRKRFHWLGQRNKYGQTYLTRNCFFEPSDESKDWADSCLLEIETAFSWKKPAVISSHRVNYVGGLSPENRSRGLRNLKSLLQSILKKWPAVEFMTSSELGHLITSVN